MKINDMLSQSEILCQLAEEAAELAQAALKLRRAMANDNPTPIDPRAAVEALEEEIADVSVCLAELLGIDWARVERITTVKSDRWKIRLEDAHGMEQ